MDGSTTSDLTVPLLKKPQKKRASADLSAARAKQLDRAFKGHLQLAFFVALWTTFFSLPLVWPWMHEIAFGAAICAEDDHGRMVNAAPGSKKPQLIYHNRTAMGAWSVNNAEYPGVWCGFMASSFEGYWHNVVIMIIFTVYQKTGTTINLAWQGITGTLYAVLNVYVMTFIFPSGARGHECTKYEQLRKLCTPGSIVYDDPNYLEWVCWANTLFVLFLFLISNSAVNTIKFGMSWHVYFMMTFMDPRKGPSKGSIATGIPGIEWDSEATLVLITSTIGGLIAILATLGVGRTMLNITHVQQVATDTSKAMRLAWNDALKYFAGPRPTAECNKVGTRIMVLSETVACMGASIEGAWWETFDLVHFFHVRSLFSIFHKTLASLEDVMQALKDSVISEDFEGSHKEFCLKMGPNMEKLKDKTAALMDQAILACADGYVDESEQAALQAQIDSVKEQKQLLRTAWFSWNQNKPRITHDLANEMIFMFSLSAWSQMMTDFAESITLNAKSDRRSRHIWDVFASLYAGVHSTWSVREMMKPSHLNFALRNMISISLCFVLGFYLDSSVFTRYSATMAGSLALLLSRFSGSAFMMNLHRLLGVALGNILPILIITGIAFTTEGSRLRLIVHSSAIMIYMFMSCFLYYASDRWATIGCLIAAFGASIMLHANRVPDFAKNYKDLGQVVFAIIVQLLVDRILKSESPRDLVVQQIRLIKHGFASSYEAFFAGDMKALQEHIRNLKGQLAVARSLAPEADPALEIARTGSTPFKIKLCNSAFEQMKLILGDLSMLALSAEGNPMLLQVIHSKPAMQQVKDDINDTLEKTLQTLISVLAHKSDEAVQEKCVLDLMETSGLQQLDGAKELVEQLNASPKELQLEGLEPGAFSLVVRALENAARHLDTIAQLCLKERIY